MGLKVLYTTGVKFTAGQGSCMHQQRLAIRPLRTSMELRWNAHMILCRAFNLIQCSKNLHYILEKNILYTSLRSVLSKIFMPVRVYFDITSLSSESM